MLFLIHFVLTEPMRFVSTPRIAGNWIAEFKKWCPSINAVKMGGKKEERARFLERDLPLVMSKEVHAVVTSYEGLLKEKSKLSKIPWKYLIIDEVSSLRESADCD